MRQNEVVLTLEEIRTLYEKHIGAFPANLSYAQGLSALVRKFGGPRVMEMATEINPIKGEMVVMVSKIIKGKDTEDYRKNKTNALEMLKVSGWELGSIESEEII